jgi:hypothetical protein
MPPMLAANTVRYGPPPAAPGGALESMTIGTRSKPGCPVRIGVRHLRASAGSGHSTTSNARGHLETRRAVVR